MANDLNLQLTIRADGTAAVTSLRQVASATESIGGAAAQAEAQAGGLTGLFEGLGRQALYLNEIKDTLGQVAGALKSVTDLADGYQTLAARAGNVSASAVEANTALEALAGIAARTHVPLLETGNLFTRLATATKDLKVPQQDLLQFTEAINNALRLNGTTAAEASGAMLQLSQALGAGALRGEEFNSVNEQMPAVLDALAQYLGKTRGELKALAEQGALTTNIVLNAVRGMGDRWAEEAGKLPVTLNQALTDVESAWAAYLGRNQTVKDAMGGLSGALEAVSQNLDAIVPVAGAAVGALGGLQIARTLGPAIGSAAGQVLLLARSLPAMNAGLLASQAASGAAAGGMALLKGSMAALGGPAGIILLAASALGVWALASRETSVEAQALAKDLEKSSAAWRDLTEAQKQSYLQNMSGDRLAQLKFEIAETENLIAATQRNLDMMRQGIAVQLASGVAAEQLAGGHKALEQQELALRSAQAKLEDQQRRLNEAQTQASGNDLSGYYAKVQAAVGQVTTQLERLQKIRDAENRADQAQAEAQATYLRMLGDERGALEATASAQQRLADRSRATVEAKQAEVIAQEQALKALQELVAANPSLLAAKAEELRSLEAEVAMLKASSAEARAKAQSDQLAADQARLAGEAYGDQSDNLDRLRSLYQSSRASMDLYTGSVDLVRQAGEELADVQQKIAEKADQLAKSLQGQGAVAAQVEDEIAALQQREIELEQTIELSKKSVDEARVSQEELNKARAEYLKSLSDAIDAAGREVSAKAALTNQLQQELQQRQSLLTAQGKELTTRAEIARLTGQEEDAVRLTAEALRVETEAKEEAISGAYTYAQALKAEADALTNQADRVRELALANDGELDPAEKTAIANAEASAKAKQMEADAARQTALDLDKQTQAEKDLAEATGQAAEAAAAAADEQAKAARESVVYTDLIATELAGLADQYEALGDTSTAAMLRSKETLGDYWRMWGAGQYPQQIAALNEQLTQLGQRVAYVDSLTDALQSGSYSAAQLAEATRIAQTATERLGAERLEALRSAIQAAQQDMEDLRREADDTLKSWQDKLDQLRGNQLDIAARQRLSDLADLQAQLDAAVSAGNAEAAANIRAAIEAAKAYWDEYIAGLKAADEAASNANLPGVTDNGDGTITSGGDPLIRGSGGSSDGNITGKMTTISSATASDSASTRQVSRVVEVRLSAGGETAALYTDEELTDKVLRVLEAAQKAA